MIEFEKQLMHQQDLSIMIIFLKEYGRMIHETWNPGILYFLEI